MCNVMCNVQLSQYVLAAGAGAEGGERYENVHGDRYEDIHGQDPTSANQVRIKIFDGKIFVLKIFFTFTFYKNILCEYLKLVIKEKIFLCNRF